MMASDQNAYIFIGIFCVLSILLFLIFWRKLGEPFRIMARIFNWLGLFTFSFGNAVDAACDAFAVTFKQSYFKKDNKVVSLNIKQEHMTVDMFDQMFREREHIK